MIDDSPAGSWAAILPFCTQIKVIVDPVEAFARQLELNLAARRRSRPAKSAASSKGWVTRRRHEMRADLGMEPI